MQTYSNRILSLSESATIAVSQLARKLKSQGKDVLDFSAGEPDFDTPQAIKDEALRALNVGFTKYTAVSGIPELLEAISQQFQRNDGVDYKKDEIIVSNGAKQSLFNSFQALINEGDEVLIPTPCWVSYPEMVKFSGGVPVYVPTKEEFSFKANGADFAKYITNKTKMIVLTSPSNPTGMIYDKNELEDILKIANEHKLWIISDEMYARLSYDKKAVSLISLVDINSDMAKRIITINGLSKSVAMTGWRVGWAACKDKQLIKYMDNLQSQSTSNINSITQKAAIVAVSSSVEEDIESMREIFKTRRDKACEILQDIAGLSALKPDGAFYLFINVNGVKGYNGDSMQFCKDLLEVANVALVPGSAFNMDGYVRMSIACDMDSIKEGLERMKEFVLSR